MIDIVLSIIKMETNFGKWKPNFTPAFCAKRRSRHYRKNHPKYVDFKTLSHAQLFSQGIYLGILFVFGRIIRQITPVLFRRFLCFHYIGKMESKKTPKRAGHLFCECCRFRCSKNSDWERHLATRKHFVETERVSNGTPESAAPVVELSCDKCRRMYQTRTGLWKHKQKCSFFGEAVSEESAEPESDTTVGGLIENSTVPPELIAKIVAEVHKQLGISEIIKTNQELVKIVKDTNDTVARTVNHHNTQNNHFNVSFFLNEKCKDAINFTDFINSIVLDQNDLKTVVKHGHVDGNTKIISDMLERLGVYRRPIHCLDAKRETVYIRENDEWEKEQAELPRIKKLANIVSHKVLVQSNVWHEQNPVRTTRELKDESLDIMRKAIGNDIEGDEKRIMKQVIQQVEVDKATERAVAKSVR